MKGLRTLMVVLLVSAISWQPIHGDEQTAQLVRQLPSEINTLSILRLNKILKSPQGTQENWAAELQQAMDAGISDLPPWIDTLVVGSLTHPQVPQEVWAAGVLQRPSSVSLVSIAQHFSTPIVSVAKRSVMETNRGSFLVDLPGNTLGFYRPAHRQELAKWIRQVTSGSASSIPDYLHHAALSQDDLVLSIDLQDTLSPEFVRQQLEQDPRFAQHQALIDELVPLITGLKGVTLTVDVARVTECQISIDFSTPVGPSGAIVKTLFLAILEDAGATIEEFTQAHIKTVENSVQLHCQLTTGSLHRLISLIVPPRAPHELPAETEQAQAPESNPAPPANTTAESRVDVQARANRRYLSSVNRMIDDLFRSSQSANNARGSMAWHETFARRIESLPAMNVDPELLDFGSRTAQRFRSLASSLRGQAIQVDTRNQAITHEVTRIDPGWAYASYWGGFGYRPANVEVRSNVARIREQQADAVITGSTERGKIWDLIRADQAAMNAKWSGSAPRQ